MMLKFLRNFFSVLFNLVLIVILKYLKIVLMLIINPIPLVQNYLFEENKARLKTVEKYKFYITDIDDQLLSMIGYINRTRYYKRF